MAAIGCRRSASTESEENRTETLDPRICVELEKLNKASENINCWELELDEARLLFRHLLTKSTQQLNDLSNKLGSCIEKSRSYYEARVKLTEAQRQVQNAALRFERACSQLTAAKEMVNLAEQGYFNHGQPFDPAWQEMLNHGTMKVNDAESERLESEIEHKHATQVLNDAEQLVKKLQRDWKRNIAKSRPYFELKAKVNHQMEDQKKKVSDLEARLSKAKTVYAQTLRNLEKISDEIHRRRRQRERRHEKRRAKAESRGSVIYHPLMNSSPEEDSGNDMSSGDEVVHSVSVDSMSVTGTTVSVTVQHVDVPPSDSNCDIRKLRNPQSVMLGNGLRNGVFESTAASSNGKCSVSNLSGEAKSTLGAEKSPAKVPYSTGLNDSTISSPDADSDPVRMNAAVMAAVSRSKQQRVVGSPFLRPNASRDDFTIDGSETDSVSGSFVSGSVCNLNDEQIESLMRDTDEYRRIVATMDAAECDQFSRLPLPARLRHLRDYFNFEPTWEDDDDSVLATVSGGNCYDTASWDTSVIAAQNGSSTSSAYSSECFSGAAVGCSNGATCSSLANAIANDSNSDRLTCGINASTWHPLADCVKSNESG